MLDTKLTIGQVIVFENTICSHQCTVELLEKKFITVKFNDTGARFRTEIGDKSLRELRLMEKIYNPVNINK